MLQAFTEDDFRKANSEWGCNCGPSALAFAIECSLDKVRDAIPMFAERKYTAPMMMRQALANLGRGFTAVRKPTRGDMFSNRIALVRIQWTGSWTTPKPQRWAARYTHWITTWGADRLFDCNGGAQGFCDWQLKIAPLLMLSYKNCDGWEPANVWRLDPLPPRPRAPIDVLVDRACGATQ